VFEIDSETMLPVKAHTYVFDIAKPEDGWKYDHEMTELYGMKDLSPRSFSDLSDRMLVDEQLAVTYV